MPSNRFWKYEPPPSLIGWRSVAFIIVSMLICASMIMVAIARGEKGAINADSTYRCRQVPTNTEPINSDTDNAVESGEPQE
jgi:hypothetical protein